MFSQVLKNMLENEHDWDVISTAEGVQQMLPPSFNDILKGSIHSDCGIPCSNRCKIYGGLQYEFLISLH